MNFVTIDVETANPDMASICQIGIAKYRNGVLIDEWLSLVNPKDYFHHVNISIHGITENDVKKAPTFPKIYQQMAEFIGNDVLVSHTHFDRVSIYQAIDLHDLIDLDVAWLDSAQVARRTWETCAWRGYGLKNVCNIIGYEFAHHDALEDAKASGQIILAACEITGNTIDDWLIRVEERIGGNKVSGDSLSKLQANPDGYLYGESMVFTGNLSLTRMEAATKSSDLGCTIQDNVTKKTTILVVGNQDLRKLNGYELSTKHRKALELIEKGISIRIIQENDFIKLFNSSQLE